MRWIRVSPLLVTLACLSSILYAQQSSTLDEPAIEHRVSQLVGQMTLEEKIAQTVHFADSSTGPGSPHPDYREQIGQGNVGSIENITGADETNALQKLAIEKTRLHIPLIFALDVIHGYRTIFPVPLAMSSTWDPDLVEQASRMAAKEASREGIRWTFSPMVDIARDARWGRMVEGAGEDPYLGSVMAAAYVRGYQGARLDAPDSILACAKHFVAYGAAEAGRDYNSVDISDRSLRQTYLPPFHAAVLAGAGSVMSAFNSLNGVPATANRFTLTQILRQEWKFSGIVISDYGSVAELIHHGIAVDGKDAARKSILAGLDIDLEGNMYSRHLAELVRSGAVPEAAVDEAARRVLRIKFALGLFDHPYTDESSVKPTTALDPAHVELARTLAERSFVLLKNGDNRTEAPLPLSQQIHTVALVGPLADSAAHMMGPWHARGDVANVVTLRSALAARMQQSGRRMIYAMGTEIDSNDESGFTEAISAARQADVVLIALGEDASWMSAEAASRAHLGLPGNQEELLEQVAATGKPVVLLVFSGRPLTLTWAAGHVSAILQAWFPGVQAGPALVRTVFGDVSPSGKLTVSMPRSVGQEPLYYNEFNTGRPAGGVDLARPPHTNKEKFVSRYIDEQNSPLFPFGYGLTYSKFTYSPLQLSTSQVSAKVLNEQPQPQLRVSTTITNSGSRAADEVAELYIRLRGTSVALPQKQLEGFRKINLAPGESKRIEFDLGRDELSFWNVDMQNMVEPALATVWIGPSSAEGQPADFLITK